MLYSFPTCVEELQRLVNEVHVSGINPLDGERLKGDFDTTYTTCLMVNRAEGTLGEWVLDDILAEARQDSRFQSTVADDSPYEEQLMDLARWLITIGTLPDPAESPYDDEASPDDVPS